MAVLAQKTFRNYRHLSAPQHRVASHRTACNLKRVFMRHSKKIIATLLTLCWLKSEFLKLRLADYSGDLAPTQVLVERRSKGGKVSTRFPFLSPWLSKQVNSFLVEAVPVYSSFFSTLFFFIIFMLILFTAYIYFTKIYAP